MQGNRRKQKRIRGLLCDEYMVSLDFNVQR